MKTLLLLALLMAIFVPDAGLACAPSKLTKIVVVNATPGLAANHWSRQPLVIYRQGERFIRTEEPRDSDQKLHLMVVISEPDVWFVNKEDGAGKHIVDPGPQLSAHAPILANPSIPSKFLELEYGCEAEFVRTNSLAVMGERNIENRRTKVYALIVDDQRLEIALADRGEPAEVSYYAAGKALSVIRYRTYQADLPDQPALFAKPEGYAYSEDRESGAAPETYLYLVNAAGKPIKLNIDGRAFPEMGHLMALALRTTVGAHLLQLGPPQASVNIDLTAAQAIPDAKQRRVWCLLVGQQKEGTLKVISVDPAACRDLVAKGLDVAPLE